MEFTVEISKQAEADFEEAYLHIAKDSPQNAFNWRLELEDKICSLKTFPERCGLAPEHSATKRDSPSCQTKNVKPSPNSGPMWLHS